MVTERSELTEALIEVIAPLEADDRRRVDASLGRFDGRRVRVYGAELRTDKRPANLPGRAVGVLTTSYELSAGSRAYRRAPDRVSTVSATKLHLGGLRAQGGTRQRTVGGEVVAFVRDFERGQEVLPTCVDLRRCSAGGWWLVHCRVHDAGDRSGDAVRGRGSERSGGQACPGAGPRARCARRGGAADTATSGSRAIEPDRGRVRRKAQHQLVAIIARTGGQATFRVAFCWNRE